MTTAKHTIQPHDFVDRNGRRVLTNAGAPGMDSRSVTGSATEIGLASIAAIIYAHAKHLNHAQLGDIDAWVHMYKSE